MKKLNQILEHPEAVVREFERQHGLCKLRLRDQQQIIWNPNKPRRLDLVRKALRETMLACTEGKLPWPLFLHGEAGSGKTCAALVLSDRCSSVYYSLEDCAERYRQAMKGELCYSTGYKITTHEVRKEWKTRDLAILEELGAREHVSDHMYLCLQRCIDDREGRPLILISNLSISELNAVYGDRIASRISAGTSVSCEGDRRLRRRGAAAARSEPT